DKLSMIIILVTPDESFNGITANWASLATGVGAVAVPGGEAQNISQAMVEVIEGLNKQLPAVLLVDPENLDAELTDEAEPEFEAPRTGAVPQASQVTRAAKSLAQARWPLIIAGRGARHAKSSLLALANTSGTLWASAAGAHGHGALVGAGPGTPNLPWWPWPTLPGHCWQHQQEHTDSLRISSSISVPWAGFLPRAPLSWPVERMSLWSLDVRWTIGRHVMVG